jgi:hypothetical protein
MKQKLIIGLALFLNFSQIFAASQELPSPIPHGTLVEIQRLNHARQHNNKMATYLGYNPNNNRHLIALDDDRHLSLQRSNFEIINPGRQLKITGLIIRPEYNNKVAIYVKYNHENNRHLVRLEENNSLLHVRQKNLQSNISQDGELLQQIIESIFSGSSQALQRAAEQRDGNVAESLSQAAAAIGAVPRTVNIIFTSMAAREERQEQQRRLSQEELHKLGGESRYARQDATDTCSVCLNTLEEGEQIRELSCEHLYHKECIDPWLTGEKNTCPVCRKEIK